MTARTVGRLCCLLLLVGVAAGPVTRAGVRTVSWSPSLGAKGYKVFYGSATGGYTKTVNVGNTTTYQTESLDDCTTWFFAVTAYNTNGESGYSPEASWLTPLTVDSATPVNPGPIVQGQQLTMTIKGAGFDPNAVIEVENPEWSCGGLMAPDDCEAHLEEVGRTVRFSNATITCNKIDVAATIEPVASGAVAALTGEYTVTVTNPGDKKASKKQAFKVSKNVTRFDINESDDSTKDRLDGKDVIWLSRLFQTCMAPGNGSLPCSDEASPYDPDYDFDGNGWIDGDDLADIAANFGTCWDSKGKSWKESACQ